VAADRVAEQVDRSIADAIAEAEELFSAGKEPAGLARLRRAMSEHETDMDMGFDEKTQTLQATISSTWLSLRAREAFWTLHLGQGADSPHGWLVQYEMANPSLPEGSTDLRVWMDRLRVAVAIEHGKLLKAAAWSFDLLDLATGDEVAEELKVEALGNLAVLASKLDLRATAKSLYRQAMEQPATPANQVSVALRLGSHLFEEDEAAALALYEQAIETLAGLDRPTARDHQEMVRALQRRADCRIRGSDPAGALEDATRGMEFVERAREKSRYTATRAVDHAIEDDLRHLLRVIPRCADLDDAPAAALGMFLRAGNSSMAAALRCDPRVARSRVLTMRDPSSAAEPIPEGAVFLPEDSVAVHVQAALSPLWAPVSDDAIASVGAEAPTLMVALTGIARDFAAGFSLLSVDGDLTLHPWQLGGEEGPIRRGNASLARLFGALLSPATGDALDDGSASRWTAEAPELRRLAAALLPLTELEAALSRGLAIAPLGAMWRFPFSALPIDGRPLGTQTALVLAVAGAANAPAPVPNGRWAGHFDLSLGHAVADQCNAAAAARASGASLHLFDQVGELDDLGEIERLFFSGHGAGVGSTQHLRLAGGERLGCDALPGLAIGASCILDACWSGVVLDAPGTEPVDLALSLLMRGAHSVWSASGPVLDSNASLLLSTLLDELSPERSLAEVAQRGLQKLLEREPGLSLAEWAPYVTIGRAPYHSVP
jgi:hypothetical protein